MKKQTRKLVALLLVGAFFVLQASMPVTEATQDTDNDSEIAYESVASTTASYSYTSKRTVTGNMVALRRYANISSEALLRLTKGQTVYVDGNHMQFEDKMYWYPCKVTYNGDTYYGFIAKDYVSAP